MNTVSVRAMSVLAAGQNPSAQTRDTLLLDHEERRSPQGVFTALRGTRVDLALPQRQRLHSGDCLVLEDGGLVEVLARPEPLLEVRAADASALARLARLLGDHHIPVEIHERRLRLRPTEAVRALLHPFGARLIDIEAPFEPEGGAYDGAVHR